MSAPSTLPRGVSCTLPCYNEEANVTMAVSALSAALEQELGNTIEDYEILCVDDGSFDQTASRIGELQQQHPRLRLLCHPTNLGYGAALRSGLRASRFDLLFFSDADNQFDYADIRKFLALAASSPVLCGYRHPRRDPWLRRLNGWAWNVLLRALFGYLVRDVNCAFKLFQRAALDQAKIESLCSSGALINAELLILLKRMGHPLREMPVTHLFRIHGKPSGADAGVILRAFSELWKMRQQLR